MNKVIIFSAPSGSGKTTLVKHCLEQFPELQFSVSCTTRLPRGEEQHGVDYHFLSPEEFREKIRTDLFVEYEEVYENLFYGTLKSEVAHIWENGKTVIFDVDVQGGIALKNYFRDQALSLFIMPPSVAELELRLRTRGTDSEETIKMRVKKAAEEMSYKHEFDQIIINSNLELAKTQVTAVVAEFLKS